MICEQGQVVARTPTIIHCQNHDEYKWFKHTYQRLGEVKVGNQAPARFLDEDVVRIEGAVDNVSSVQGSESLENVK